MTKADADALIGLFRGRKLVIATKHAKERVIAPLLEKHLGVEAVVPKQFDSDQFGTFTREIKRAGNQLEAARAKAQAAMAREGADLAVASEGSFAEHPSLPLALSNFELVLLVDRKNNYEVRGHYRTLATNLNGRYVSDVDEALALARASGFPGHGLIVRPTKDGRENILKDIRTEEALAAAVNSLLAKSPDRRVFLETDLRAHRNPTRMKAIREATKDLIKNISSLCPQCQTPGFVAVAFGAGLKCAVCGRPTSQPLYGTHRCETCRHSEKRVVGRAADPRHCDYCNP